MSKLEYRMDFVANIIRSLSSLALGYISFTIIFANTQSLVGWNKSEAFVMYGVFVCINELYYALFSQNLLDFPRNVQRGDLDGLLLKPVSTQFLISLQYMLVFALPNVLISFFIIFASLNSLHLHVDVLKVLITAFMIINGLLILYSIMLIAVTTTFWITRLKAFWTFYEGMTEGARYPVDIFKGGMHFFFTFIIPIAFIFTFPAQFLVKGLSVGWIITTFAIGIWFVYFAHYFFHKGILKYNSASS